MSAHLSYVEAVVVGAFQGVTELFPVSSLGHSVLVPALVGGQWAPDLNVSAPESPYLAFLVGPACRHRRRPAGVLLADWLRIVAGFVSSVATSPNPDSGRAAGLADRGGHHPGGIVRAGPGTALSHHTGQTHPGGGIPAPQRRRPLCGRGAAPPHCTGGAVQRTRRRPTSNRRTRDEAIDNRLAQLPVGRGVLIGSAQILALLPGISRSGIAIVAGLWRGLSHEDAARFSFLLATPIILAAGVYKIPDLFGPLGTGILGQVLAGSVASFVCAYLAVRYLTRYFQTRTLTPFAIYCAVAGATSLVWLTLR